MILNQLWNINNYQKHKQKTRLAKLYIDSEFSHHVLNDKPLLITFVNPCPKYTIGKINGRAKNSGAKIFG